VSANLWTQAGVFWEYAGLYAWPARLNAARGGTVAASVAAPGVLLALAGLALWAGLALALARRRPLAAFGLLWFPLVLAPTSSFVPLNVIAAEHRLYLPALGLLLAGASLLAPLVRSPAACAGAAALVAAALGLRAAAHERAFRDEVALWGTAAAQDPTSFRARLLLGNAHAARQEWGAAAGAYREALALYPRMVTGWINQGEALRRVGLERRDRAAFDEGEEALRRALALEPRSLLTHLKLARLRLDAGRTLEDRARLEAAARGLEELPPRSRQNPYVRLHLAGIRRALGDEAAAEALIAGLVKDTARDPSAAFEAATLLEDLGERAAAARLHEAVLGWVPFHRAARERLGRLLLATPGREAEGAAHLRQAGNPMPSVR
jgi:tetratricopeptide (TPR) repeat protein